ncbi:hypothetical protein MJ8_56280 [Mesorhizobium sp. J8]|nr:hypothetical protein MJ8_56280 [Mesorhizobium sp. J8]
MPAGLSSRKLDRTFHGRFKAHLYIIRNGRTTPAPGIVKATLPDIAEKAVSSLIKTQGIGDLYRLYMRALFEKGYEMGRAGVPWKHVPPGFLR